jgi:hypothetical protein
MHPAASVTLYMTSYTWPTPPTPRSIEPSAAVLVRELVASTEEGKVGARWTALVRSSIFPLAFTSVARTIRPVSYCLPRHRMPFNSNIKGLTWRSISLREISACKI